MEVVLANEVNLLWPGDLDPRRPLMSARMVGRCGVAVHNSGIFFCNCCLPFLLLAEVYFCVWLFSSLSHTFLIPAAHAQK